MARRASSVVDGQDGSLARTVQRAGAEKLTRILTSTTLPILPVGCVPTAILVYALDAKGRFSCIGGVGRPMQQQAPRRLSILHR